ncbi:MAG: AMP-binding protein, partial [Promethearchaeota archaeon]
MQVAKGRITTKKSGNGGYKSAWIYIPSKVYKNEDFPFSDNEEVIIEIEEDSLKITKNDERSRIVRNFGMENATLPRLLEIKAKGNRDQPFLFFKDTCYSYQETNEISNRYSHGIIKILSELDLKSPKIALLMDSCPEFIFTWFGIVKAGCVFVPIDVLSSEEVVGHVLNDSDAEVLILDYKFLENFEKIKNDLPKIKKVIIRNAP